MYFILLLVVLLLLLLCLLSKFNSIGIACAVISITLLISMAISLCFIESYYEKHKVIDYKDFGNEIVIKLDNNKIIHRSGLEWRYCKVVYKKTRSSWFGETSTEWILEKD